jgi:hypothetical protein
MRQDIWCFNQDDRSQRIMHGIIHVFHNVDIGDVIVCRSAQTQVWNGSDWVQCDGPNGHIDNRCPDCDFRSVSGG